MGGRSSQLGQDENSILEELGVGGGGGIGGSAPIAGSSLPNDDTQHQLVSTVRLYCIQTKQLQEMQIFLSGEQSENFYNSGGGASPPPPPSAIPAVGLNSSQASSMLSTSLTVTPGGANQTLNTAGLAASSSSSILQQLLGNSNISAATASPILGMIPQRPTPKPAINLGYKYTYFFKTFFFFKP